MILQDYRKALSIGKRKISYLRVNQYEYYETRILDNSQS